jgi:hypothetical protein
MQENERITKYKTKNQTLVSHTRTMNTTFVSMVKNKACSDVGLLGCEAMWTCT